MRSVVGCLVGVAVMACGDESFLQKIVLTAAPTMPRAETALLDGTIQLAAVGLEPLIDKASYVVWLTGRGEAHALGTFDPRIVVAAYPVDVSWIAAGASEVIVTEEAAEWSLPDAPSQLVRLRGPLGAAADYVPACAATVASMTGSADVDDTKISLMVMPPSPLPAGLFYAAWGLWGTSGLAASSGGTHNHQMLGEPGSVFKEGDHGTAGAEPTAGGPCQDYSQPTVSLEAGATVALLGEIDAQGMLVAALATPQPPSTMREIVITIESRRGREGTMSPAIALRGQMLLPLSRTATSGH